MTEVSAFHWEQSSPSTCGVGARNAKHAEHLFTAEPILVGKWRMGTITKLSQLGKMFNEMWSDYNFNSWILNLIDDLRFYLSKLSDFFLIKWFINGDKYMLISNKFEDD